MIFQKKNINTVTDRERIQKEARQASDEAIGAAQDCLNTEQFKHYRDQYEQMERKLFEELIWIDCNEYDPIKYGFKVKDVISKLRHVGSLLRGVYGDAGKDI